MGKKVAKVALVSFAVLGAISAATMMMLFAVSSSTEWVNYS